MNGVGRADRGVGMKIGRVVALVACAAAIAGSAAGQPHPLKESTIYDIRDLFGLIAEREAGVASLTILANTLRNTRKMRCSLLKFSFVTTGLHFLICC